VDSRLERFVERADFASEEKNSRVILQYTKEYRNNSVSLEISVVASSEEHVSSVEQHHTAPAMC